MNDVMLATSIRRRMRSSQKQSTYFLSAAAHPEGSQAGPAAWNRGSGGVR